MFVFCFFFHIFNSTSRFRLGGHILAKDNFLSICRNNYSVKNKTSDKLSVMVLFSLRLVHMWLTKSIMRTLSEFSCLKLKLSHASKQENEIDYKAANVDGLIERRFDVFPLISVSLHF